jgi:hypothetical protein
VLTTEAFFTAVNNYQEERNRDPLSSVLCDRTIYQACREKWERLFFEVNFENGKVNFLNCSMLQKAGPREEGVGWRRSLHRP